MPSEPTQTGSPATGADALLVGCGDLGTSIGFRLAARGQRVVALRRRADLVPPPLEGIAADLTAGPPALPPMDLEHLVVALTARPRSEEAYRSTYVEGLGYALDGLEAVGAIPRRAVLVSSTAVYGVVAEGELVDESTHARPADGPGRMLLEAERLFLQRVPHGTVLRLSGLYGRGPSRFADQVLSGKVTDPDRWTNRLHRDDAAEAVVHLLTRPVAPGPLYVGTDDEPAVLGEVAAYLAQRIGGPRPPKPSVPHRHGKRLSNARLRATGWEPAYPSYREGYRDYPALGTAT
ncbi:NAD-dependent epimerase/dehydratase family protein [Nocardioides campestrisoli]|uniref:NAD-dependent epimerase/dehydratase family protein n=1 Tax=Nocardioides campestrisoli TaxID=2736757 RepID=UPI0015E64017|nr:NAD-dependent epimerase/dehydratase family protein [Nocardioides campestrisoli]